MAHANVLGLTISQFVDMVGLELKLPIKKRRTIFGIGQFGIGKTVALANLAKELGIGFIDLRLSNYTETDLKGIPTPDKDGVTANWLTTGTLPNEQKHGKEGILLLDEITGASRATRLAVYQLIEKGQLENYTLPEGWYIVACGNHEEDMVEVYNALSMPLKNRGFCYNLVSDVNSFKNWGRLNGVHPMVLAYVSWSPDSLHDIPEDVEDVARSPRAWETISDTLLLSENGTVSKDLMYNRIAGAIGVEETNRFFAFCNFKDSIPNIDDLLAGKINPEIKQSEIMHLTIQSGINRLVSDAEKEFVGDVLRPSEPLITKFAHFCNWLLNIRELETKSMGINDLKSCMKISVITSIMMNVKFNALCPTWAKFAQDNVSLFV